MDAVSLPDYVIKLIDREFELMCINIMTKAKDPSGGYISVQLEDIFEYLQLSMIKQASFWMGQTIRKQALEDL
jgi:hypothetical protein